MSDVIEILIDQKNEALDERARLIEERTEARAEAFRAQERVRELEDWILWCHRTDYPMSALCNKAVEIATKRREGK